MAKKQLTKESKGMSKQGKRSKADSNLMPFKNIKEEAKKFKTSNHELLTPETSKDEVESLLEMPKTP